MRKENMNKIKSAVISGTMAVSALAAPLSAAVTPSLTASAVSNDNYAKLLQYSLYFYDANMCGKEVGTKSALSWRDNCHTTDAVDGGFHDAGDHVKFGLPAGYSASTLGWSYYEFKDAYDATGQGAHYKTIADHFAEYFRNSTTLSGNTVTNFVYQIGNGQVDHDVWCAPEVQTDSGNLRQVYQTSSGASDIAASYAAALAVNYINFGNPDDLKYAKALFDFSTKYNECASEGTEGFYFNQWSDYYDDQAWAAGWLYKATGDSTYSDFLYKFMHSSNQGRTSQMGGEWGVYSTMSWNNVTMGAAILEAEINNTSDDWKKVTIYLNQNGAQSSSYYFEDQWGSARYNTAQQMAALVATKYGAADYGSWAQGQMDYILGNNPANTCFVTGFASNSAKNAHHRAASGWSSFDEMGDSTVYKSGSSHTLIGALVGGPTDANGTYTDSLKDYAANEVTLDYNATLVGAAAGLYSIYKTGSVDSSIEGVGAVTTATATNTNTQTTATTKTTETTTTTTAAETGSYYSIKPNQSVKYDESATDKMIGWDWADFNIPTSQTVSKVEVKISSTKQIGKWQGAFGTSTKVSPDYWSQGDDMEETISGTSGTITWDVPADTAAVIQYGYGGQLKFGTWWIDSQAFTVDEVIVYTGNAGSSTTTASTTKSGSTTTTTTTAAKSGEYTITPAQHVTYDESATDKMIGWDWADFNIPSTEKVTKVEVNISATKQIGKWQGAFGTSTKVSPDYWSQGDDMEKTISGTSGTITWTVPSSIAEIIQYGYGGQLKFGTWWIDSQEFTVNSVKVYTDGTASTTTTTTTKATTTTTTTKATTTTTITTTSTTTATSSNVKATLYGDANEDGEVNIADAVLILQSISNPDKYQLTAQGSANADVVDNDGVTSKDALAIQEVEGKKLSQASLPITSSQL